MNNCQPNCGCKFEVDSSCVRYTGVSLSITSISTGDTVETAIIKIEEALIDIQQSFTLKPATPLLLGGVKIGNGINVTTDGIISVTPYSLPISTSSVLGGVKIGSGINVSNDGTISVTPSAQYSLPIATSTILGGVKIGNGLTIDGQGVLSSKIGQGTLNYISKFTPDGYSIDDSQIVDDGDKIFIGNTPTENSKFYIETEKRISLHGKVLKSGSGDAYGLYGQAIASSTSTSYTYGVSGYASGAQINVGIYGIATQDSGIKIGLFGSASGQGSNYAIMLQDGSQQIGRFLKCVGSAGEGRWADINPQKTITNSYTLTAADNGYSIIVENGANAVTITVPSGLPASTQVGFIQDGTGDVTFSGASVTLKNAINGFKIKGQNDQAFLEKKGTQETYYLLGNVKV